MISKKTATITAIVLSTLIFVTINFTINGSIASFASVIVFFLCLLYFRTINKRCFKTLNRIIESLNHPDVIYAGVAGLMINGREIVGALALTKSRIIYQDNREKIEIDLQTKDINAENLDGFLCLKDCEGSALIFKVLDVEKIVESIKHGY